MAKVAREQRVGVHGRRTPLATTLSIIHARRKASRTRRKAQAGIQSLETGLAVLKTVVAASAPMKLRDIAAASRMSPSKTHRYAVSLCRSGFLVQDADASYRLGHYALEMAVACFNAVRPVKLASQSLDSIGRELGLTVAIATWGNHGPTIVRIEESLRAVSMNVRPGTVVPLSRSASGLVFAAYMPRHVVEPLLAAELAADNARAALEHTLAEVRRTGVASVAQKLVPGADAIAVPIFDHRGAAVLSLLAVGTSNTFPLEPDAIVAQVLKRYARDLSRQLGYQDAKPEE